jgi:hypothetical protein
MKRTIIYLPTIILIALFSCSKKSDPAPVADKDATVGASSMQYTGLGTSPQVIILDFTDNGVSHHLTLSDANLSSTYDASVGFDNTDLSTASSTSVTDPNSVGFFDISNLRSNLKITVTLNNPKGGYKSITVTSLAKLIVDGQSNTPNYVGANTAAGLNLAKTMSNGVAISHYKATLN